MNVTDNLTQALIQSHTIDNAVKATIEHIVPIAEGLAIIFFILTTAWNFFSNSIKYLKGGEGSGFFDFEELARTLVIMFLIAVYIPATGTITDLINTLDNVTQPSVVVENKLNDYSNKQLENPDSSSKSAAYNYVQENQNFTTDEKNKAIELKNEQAQNNSSSGSLGMFDLFMRFLSMDMDATTFFHLIFTGIAAILMGAIRIVVYAFVYVVYKVLLCLGPFALAFSVLPMFRNQVEGWFGSLLNTGLTFVTLNILDIIFYEYVNIYTTVGTHLSSSAATNIATDTNIANSFSFNLVMVTCYLTSFWLTSKYVGKGDGSKILSKGVTMLTMAAMAAVSASSGASGGQNGGGGKSSNSGNVASSTKDAFKDGE